MKTGDWTMTTEAFRQWMMGFKCFLYVWKWSIPQHDNFHGEHDEHIRTGVPKWWVRFSRRLGKNHITSFKKGWLYYADKNPTSQRIGRNNYGVPQKDRYVIPGSAKDDVSSIISKMEVSLAYWSQEHGEGNHPKDCLSWSLLQGEITLIQPGLLENHPFSSMIFPAN